MCIEKTAHHNNIGRLQIHGRAPRFFHKKRPHNHKIIVSATEQLRINSNGVIITTYLYNMSGMTRAKTDAPSFITSS